MFSANDKILNNLPEAIIDLYLAYLGIETEEFGTAKLTAKYFAKLNPLIFFHPTFN